MIRREFFVDEICYVLELNEHNNIMFYVVVNKSRFIDIPRTSYDKLAKFWEDEKEFLSYTKYLVNTDIKHFFQIKSHVIK